MQHPGWEWSGLLLFSGLEEPCFVEIRMDLGGEVDLANVVVNYVSWLSVQSIRHQSQLSRSPPVQESLEQRVQQPSSSFHLHQCGV